MRYLSIRNGSPSLWWFSGLLLFAAAGLPMTLADADASIHHLPKVRVTQGGQGFVNAEGIPYVPIGINYYRPGTGWAPQVWKQFDADATRRDFARMKELT
jgi:hypothetical protein